MPSPTWTRIVIGLAASLWFAIAYFLDAPVEAAWLRPAGFVMAAVVLLLLAFDLFLWRALPIWLTKRPDIRGTWRSELHYRWPADEPPKTKECFLVVHQTFSAVSIRMLFPKFSSESLSADIKCPEKKRSLWWTYLGMPDEFDPGNPMHRGAAEAVIATVPKARLEGTYWTERGTRGRIVTNGRSTKLYEDFEQAQAAEYVDL